MWGATLCRSRPSVISNNYAQQCAFLFERKIMAKNDYDVIVFKILVYLYAVLKHEIIFDLITFKKAIKYEDINEQYFNSILDMMHKDGYIDGVVIAKAWGNDLIVASDLKDMYITSNGIHYLKENDIMNKIKNLLTNNVELISSLIVKVL